MKAAQANPSSGQCFAGTARERTGTEIPVQKRKRHLQPCPGSVALLSIDQTCCQRLLPLSVAQRIRWPCERNEPDSATCVRRPPCTGQSGRSLSHPGALTATQCALRSCRYRLPDSTGKRCTKCPTKRTADGERIFPFETQIVQRRASLVSSSRHFQFPAAFRSDRRPFRPKRRKPPQSARFLRIHRYHSPTGSYCPVQPAKAPRTERRWPMFRPTERSEHQRAFQLPSDRRTHHTRAPETSPRQPVQAQSAASLLFEGNLRCKQLR